MQYNDFTEANRTRPDKKSESCIVDQNVLSYFVVGRVESLGSTYSSSAELYGNWQEKARLLQARRWRRIKGYAS